MEHIHALLLLFLEATFIFIALALLLQQRGAIGRVAFIMCFGVLQLFGCFIAAADLRGVIVEGASFSVAETVFMVPLLASFLMVYISAGTLSAQRMIIGIVSVFGLFFYIGEVSCLQCSWLGFSFSSGISGIALETLLRSGLDSLHGAVLRHLAECIFATVCYALLGKFRWRRGPRTIGALVGAQFFGAGLRWLFARCFAQPMGITRRFVGTEPISPVTARYNETMKRFLPSQGVEVTEIERAGYGGEPISATRVRALLKEQGPDAPELAELLPQTTLDVLRENWETIALRLRA